MAVAPIMSGTSTPTVIPTIKLVEESDGVSTGLGVSVDVVTELTKVQVMMDVTKEETALDVTPPVIVDATTLLVELVALVAEIKRIN